MMADTQLSPGALRPSFVDGVASLYGFDAFERELMMRPLGEVLEHAADSERPTVMPPASTDHDRSDTVVG